MDTLGKVDFDPERYSLYSRLEIINVLRSLMDHHTLVTISFHYGERFVVTNVLAINPDFEEVIFDYGADQAMNRSLLQADKLTVVSYVDHIKIQFTANRAEATQFEGQPAFRLRLPQKILRLQRREFYRVKVPLSKPIYCEMSLAQDQPASKFRVHDLSCGGISMIGYPQHISFVPGTVFRACKIELPEVGSVTSDIDIAYEIETTHRGGEKTKRCGAAFLNMPGWMSALVQRYITKIDRERLTKD